jgi:phage shock protein PspC (stress-responsive transcriptional regulator)
MEKRLYKDQQHKMIGGVCAGLAEYFNIDVTLVRVLFFATLILKGGGLVIYIILWICLPKKPYNFGAPFVDYRVPPTPFGNEPQPPMMPYTDMPKTRSNAGVIVGAVLIIIGGLFLADQMGIIPDIDLEDLWPLILVAIGCVLIFTRGKRQPWEHDQWIDPAQNSSAGNTTATGIKNDETNTNDNHPIE